MTLVSIVTVVWLLLWSEMEDFSVTQGVGTHGSQGVEFIVTQRVETQSRKGWKLFERRVCMCAYVRMDSKLKIVLTFE